ncbi:MAG: gamma-glutamylcyclotransferase [Opitutaceae bacterium]|nr:gamma-glutamylcyclotransferase [Opitutaceae bacterium]
MSTLLFVYGTLKRGCSNHAQMAGQTFVGLARTTPGFYLYELGGYPGLVADATDRDGVTGEVWSVDAAALQRLDAFEGVAEGLYRREPVALLDPFSGKMIDAYLFAQSIAGRRRLGAVWSE